MTLYVKPGRVGASDPSGAAMARSVAGCRIQHRRSNYKKSLLKVLSPVVAPATSSPSVASLPSRPRVKRVVTYEHGRLETVLLPLLVSSTLARGGRAATPTGRINMKTTTNKPKNMMNAKNSTNVPEHEGIATADAEGFWQQLAQAEVEDIQSSNNKNQLEMSAYDAHIKQELPDYDDTSSVDSGDHAYFGGSDDDTETPQVRRSPDNAGSFAMRAPTRPFAMVKEEPMEMERDQPAPAPVPYRAPAQTRPAAAKIAAGDNTKVFIDTLLHSLDCKSCPSNACQKMRLVLGHFLTCSKNKSRTEQERKQQPCALCNQLIGIVTRHAREQCDARKRGVACPVPMCDVITEEDELEQI